MTMVMINQQITTRIHTHVGIAILTGMTNRLIMSSNTVWVRFQLMLRSLNKLMCGFGKLTLMPASFSIFSFYISIFLPLQWVSRRGIRTYSKHKIIMTHKDMVHESPNTFLSNATKTWFISNGRKLAYRWDSDRSTISCANAPWIKRFLQSHITGEYFTDIIRQTTVFRVLK